MLVPSRSKGRPEMLPITRFFCILISCVMAGALGLANSQDQPAPFFAESLPKKVQIRKELRNRTLKNLPPTMHGRSQRYVLTRLRLWNPGQTLTVAFLGGDTALHRDIEQVAQEWTRYGNIKLDFGFNPATGTYRQWSRSDTSYGADIRISFDELASGYSSSVGTESIDPAIVYPNEASLSLYNFNVAKPSRWARITSHEFGHALGFEHEHQSPVSGCDLEFKWNDDLGYVPKTDADGAYIPNGGKYPGVYTVLGGYPNYWTEAEVNDNLRQFRDSSAYYTGTFDPDSIMLYNFPAWMFANGEQSHCYHPENVTLSAGDKAGIGLVYPRAPEKVDEIIKEKKLFLETVIGLQVSSPAM
jgi:hypothetical protein